MGITSGAGAGISRGTLARRGLSVGLSVLVATGGYLRKAVYTYWNMRLAKNKLLKDMVLTGKNRVNCPSGWFTRFESQHAI
jgi:hypothetical protein